ncbi:ribonuclease III [Curvivirga aplysinae]|uniref:ribonuclease III n=1 Tax=Curvivirga aplysinae TaxID=2529852 RepID=UPI0012BD44A3|nr:ribonuclease III [Curvivirga aplysinae]MTI09014.1 ribonuclease III [Curvivirga aplysinae]
MSIDYTPFFEALGVTLSDKKRLTRALTHKSASHGRDLGYERLEFLGDRVLGLCVADMLMDAFPKEPEGALSRRLNALVRQETLAEVALEISLPNYVILGKAEEESGARHNPAILSDIVEAVIAAIYKEQGLEEARKFIHKYLEKRLENTAKPPKDAKSALQEWAMARKMPLPAYTMTDRSGPDHAPIFTIEVALPGREAVSAQGETKRVAEQKAATTMLEKLTAE